jgi:hypothetical protein
VACAGAGRNESAAGAGRNESAAGAGRNASAAGAGRNASAAGRLLQSLGARIDAPSCHKGTVQAADGLTKILAAEFENLEGTDKAIPASPRGVVVVEPSTRLGLGLFAGTGRRYEGNAAAILGRRVYHERKRGARAGRRREVDRRDVAEHSNTIDPMMPKMFEPVRRHVANPPRHNPLLVLLALVDYISDAPVRKPRSHFHAAQVLQTGPDHLGWRA